MALSDIQEVDINDIQSWPTWLKLTGAGLICIAILFAGYWFIIKDQLTTLQRAEKEELQLRQTFSKKKALAINLEAYREQMNEIQETFGVMLKQLPDKTEVPELLIDITQSGLARGLQFETFKPQNRRVADFYAELPISIQVNGTYHQLGEFVSDLAALPRIVTIGDIALSPIKDSDRLRMSAITKTYHYLDEEAIEARKKQSQGKGKKGGRKTRKRSG